MLFAMQAEALRCGNIQMGERNQLRMRSIIDAGARIPYVRHLYVALLGG